MDAAAPGLKPPFSETESFRGFDNPLPGLKVRGWQGFIVLSNGGSDGLVEIESGRDGCMGKDVVLCSLSRSYGRTLPRISSWGMISRPFGTASFWISLPRTASWATFSRPCGTLVSPQGRLQIFPRTVGSRRSGPDEVTPASAAFAMVVGDRASASLAP